MLYENSLVSDLFAAVVCCGVIFAFLLLWQVTAKCGVDQEACAYKYWASFHALLAIIQEFLLLVLNVTSYIRELLKGPLYYAITVTLACVVYWRTSPIGIAALCNLCAGDGLADVVGRRLGRKKLPYNRNKSIAGSVAMATAGFLSSVGYMYYFSYFGYIQDGWGMILRFLVVSLASALVESLPISTELDDNLTVSLTSIFIGSLIF
ncbi:hypothetical protein GOBAR_DD21133 [Gossypium barbadense]|nr:hypothetical protein GOBAR_DD21133 [Gossypium barbadense]